MNATAGHKVSKRPKAVVVITVIQSFIGLCAIGGGTLLVLSPDGSALGMNTTLLQHGLFSSFLIPGLFLAVILGITPLICVVGLWTRSRLQHRRRSSSGIAYCWAWRLTIGIALTTILWIHIQITIVGTFWIQPIIVVLEVGSIGCLSLPSAMQYCRLTAH